MKVQLETFRGKLGQIELTSIILTAPEVEAPESSKTKGLSGLAPTKRRKHHHLRIGTWAAAWHWVGLRLSSTPQTKTSR